MLLQVIMHVELLWRERAAASADLTQHSYCEFSGDVGIYIH